MSILPQSLGGAICDFVTNKVNPHKELMVISLEILDMETKCLLNVPGLLQASVQVASAQGPQVLVAMGGFVLKGVYPFVPPPGDVRLAITLFSYADQVHITALAHPSLKDAPVALLKGITLQVQNRTLSC